MVTTPSTADSPGYCPTCGSAKVQVHLSVIPPRSCRDCGDHWAGVYPPDAYLVSKPANATGEPPWCSSGHPTTWTQPGQRTLPCGCTFETATAEAFNAAGVPQPA